MKKFFCLIMVICCLTSMEAYAALKRPALQKKAETLGASIPVNYASLTGAEAESRMIIEVQGAVRAAADEAALAEADAITAAVAGDLDAIDVARGRARAARDAAHARGAKLLHDASVERNIRRADAAVAAAEGVTVVVSEPSTSSTLRALTSGLSDLTASLQARLGTIGRTGGGGAMPEDTAAIGVGVSGRSTATADRIAGADTSTVVPHDLKVAQQEGLEREQAVTIWLEAQAAREGCFLDSASVHRLRMAAMAAHGRTGEDLTSTLSKYTILGAVENLDRIFAPATTEACAVARAAVVHASTHGDEIGIRATVAASLVGGEEDPSNETAAVSVPAPSTATGRGTPPLSNDLHGEDA